MALGLVGRPSFSFGKEEYDLAVISGEPAAATRKGPGSYRGNFPLC